MNKEPEKITRNAKPLPEIPEDRRAIYEALKKSREQRTKRIISKLP